MPQFLVCIHDATPAFAGEMRMMIQDLAPLIGRRMAVGVVPNWNGAWPLEAHPEFCELARNSSDEILLHGYYHSRQRGRGPVSLLTDGCDEMKGLDREETRRTIERGQAVFAELFGEPAKGFLAPAWQRGHVRFDDTHALPLQHVLGFFSLESSSGRSIPLATWSWDCSRWAWTGHIGHGLGWLLHTTDRGVPTLAIHPKDAERGYWAKILRVIDELLESGHAPSTPTELIEAAGC